MAGSPWGLLLAATASVIAVDAAACGHCVEDAVAAVYDYQVELRADHEHMAIAYVGVRGVRAETPAAASSVAKTLRDIPNAEAGTVRTSVSPPAASFAWRGDEASLGEAMRAANAQLLPAGLKLELLKTWDSRRGLH